MTLLYIFMAMLSASVVIKLARPLLHPGAGGAPTRRHDRAMALAVIVIIPLVALIFYHMVGRPDLPGAPVIGGNYQQANDRNAAMLAIRPMQQLLSQNNEDMGALVTLGQLNYRMGKYAAAVPYFRKAAEIARESNDFRYQPLLKMLGETMVEAADGKVTPETKAVYETVLALHSTNGLARYYLALYKAQHGQREEALKEWTQVLSEGPPSIYWKQRVRDSMAKTREEMRVESVKTSDK